MKRSIVIAGLALLAACGSKVGGNEAAGNTSTAFNDSFRQSYRTKFIDSCMSGARAAAARQGNATVANADFTPLCSCAADKLLASKSATELMQGPSAADQQAVTQACLREHPIS